jgi:hypothetical protein
MIRTNHVPRAPAGRTQRQPDYAIPFVSTCPKCGRPEPQLAFSGRALQRSLDERQCIEAYCAMCDVFWPISASERAALAQDLARSGPRGTLTQAGSNRKPASGTRRPTT